ncbi:MAG: cobalamin-binding protein, partial [Planctomycetales bacterium]|nr:cobalamin-binding protein [Planctomycetales bacterium]
MAQHSRLRLSSITALTLILLTACGPQSTISPPPSATAPPATEAPTLAPTDLPAPTPTSEPRLEPTEEPQPGPIVVTDGLGRQVTLAAPAQRVVSLAPSNTEILFAIGAGPQVVGRDEFTNFPEEAQALPSVG